MPLKRVDSKKTTKRGNKTVTKTKSTVLGYGTEVKKTKSKPGKTKTVTKKKMTNPKTGMKTVTKNKSVSKYKK